MKDWLSKGACPLTYFATEIEIAGICSVKVALLKAYVFCKSTDRIAYPRSSLSKSMSMITLLSHIYK